MVVSVECTSCGVTLNIRNREILQRKMLCPQCREPLPLVLDAEEEAYVEAEINADESVEAAVVIGLGAVPTQPPADRFQKAYTPSLSLREHWWHNRNPLVLLAWLLKLLRIPLPGSPEDPAVTSLMPFLSTYRKLAPEIQTVFGPAAMVLKDEGFRSPVIYQIDDPVQNSEYHMMAVPHQSGDAVAWLQRHVWRSRLATTKSPPSHPALFIRFDVFRRNVFGYHEYQTGHGMSANRRSATRRQCGHQGTLGHAQRNSGNGHPRQSLTARQHA